MIDIREYEQLARETGAYRDIELDILRETLQSWKTSPGDPYTILELRDGKILAGFAVLSRAANTDFTFDVRTLCVERGYQDKGVGRNLLEMLENEVVRLEVSAIVRFEISREKEDAVGRGLFLEADYALIGHIRDFYSEGDDYFIYAKHLRRANAERNSDVSHDEAPTPENKATEAPSGSSSAGEDGPEKDDKAVTLGEGL